MSHPTGRGPTEGVKTLMGDPKKAIMKLAWPMIVAMSAQTIYNLVDAIWVSGLGAEALAAVGFFFPFFFLSMAIATGIGMGGSAAISRMIGAKDKKSADNVASHTIILMVISALLFTFPLVMFAPEIFSALGAGRSLDQTVAYSRIMFGGTIIVFFGNISLALLRGEGDAKRPMYAMMSGTIINIILDPFFIYPDLAGIPGLGLGVAGAAWATMISLSITSIILFNWLFMKKDTYVNFKFKGFRFKGHILSDIARVGLPASFMHMSMSIMMLFMNLIIVQVGGEDGVAVFSTGWRVQMIAVLPLLGISTAVVAVTGAAYGMKDYEKLNAGYMYAIKIGVASQLVMIVLAYVFAPNIARVFTWSEGAAQLHGDLVALIRTLCLFLPMIPFGMFSSSMFQGTGKGSYALMVTLIRTIILVIPTSWFIGVVVMGTLQGIWIGLVASNCLGSLIAFVWARIYIKGLRTGRIKREIPRPNKGPKDDSEE